MGKKQDRKKASKVAVTSTPRAVAAPGGELVSDTKQGVNLAKIAGALVAGRATLNEPFVLGGNATWLVPPSQSDETWRILDLDGDAVRMFPPHKLLEMLIDLQPDMNRAVWDFLRLTNPDWELTAYTPGTRTPDKRAIVALQDFCDLLTSYYGSVDIVFTRLYFNAWLRGAVFLELVLDADARMMIDLATPDPWTAVFRRVNDPLRGQIWQLGQTIAGKPFNVIDRPTVRYMPLDPLPNSPYGRPLASAAVFTGLFMLGLLHDIRRVVAQQGYPRLDISIDFEALVASMPEEDQEDGDKLAAWVAQHVKEITDYYKQLQPDDAYIHASTITVNRPVGAVDATSLGGIDALIKALERMLVKALKTMPLVMGTTEGVSEANANRQIELHLIGIRAVQHLVETAIEWVLKLGLRAQGIAADVEMRFAENRAAEALRDEQVRQLRITNANAGYVAGHISQDEGALYAWGHNADQAEPRGPAVNTAPGAALVDGSVKDPTGDTKTPDKKGS